MMIGSITLPNPILADSIQSKNKVIRYFSRDNIIRSYVIPFDKSVINFTIENLTYTQVNQLRAYLDVTEEIALKDWDDVDYTGIITNIPLDFVSTTRTLVYNSGVPDYDNERYTVSIEFEGILD